MVVTITHNNGQQWTVAEDCTYRLKITGRIDLSCSSLPLLSFFPTFFSFLKILIFGIYDMYFIYFTENSETSASPPFATENQRKIGLLTPFPILSSPYQITPLHGSLDSTYAPFTTDHSAQEIS